MSMTTKTFDAILADMKKNNTTGLNTDEGSFVDAILRPVAYALAAWNFDLAALAKTILPDTATGVYLENQAADYGLVRMDGARAAAEVIFAGNDGTVIPAGTAVQTRGGLVFLTDREATITNGEATVSVTAEDMGTVCNVAANTICVMQSLATVTVKSSTEATGGSDVETDDELRQRLRFVRVNTPASCNAAQYEAWVMETPDAKIGKARVFSRPAGPGTVKIVLLGEDMLPAAQEDVDKVAAHIAPRREICTEVTCEPAASTPITVDAEVVLAEGASLDAVKSTFAGLLKAYFAGLALTGQPVVYNRIAYMLLSIDGVTDFTRTTVNGTFDNVSIDDDAVAELAAVNVVEAVSVE